MADIRIHKPQLAYSLEQAAEACGISLSSLKRFIAAGDLTPRWVNTKPVLQAPELAAWLDSLPVDKPGTDSAS